MIGVTWMWTHPKLASARLRNNIPSQVLKLRGVVKDGTDLIIASKHNWDVSTVRKRFKRMIFDVCDDHFSDSRREHYLHACEVADQITCNSEVMREIIERETHRRATVIDDPYEDAELAPDGTGSGVLWFGHSLNLPDLERVAPSIRHPLTVVASHNYTPEHLDACLKACRVVILPTGKSQAKSANRAVRSIRYGKYPICGHLPAYGELGLGNDDLGLALDRAYESTDSDLVARVRALQDLVRVRFSPDLVSDAWEKVICGSISGAGRESLKALLTAT